MGAVIENGLSEVQEILQSYSGESDLKHLFWSVLGYERVNEPIACPALAGGRERLISDMWLFARHNQFAVILVRATCAVDRPLLMTLCHQLAPRFAMFVVLLEDDGGRRWHVVLPDEQTKHYLRCLAIPGYESEITETARALWAFSTVDGYSGAERSAFDIFFELDLWFPGPQLAERTDLPELDEYLSDIGSYPLLTRRQEQMPENIRRLIVHNLRLAIWVAMKFRLHGMTLADQVQNANLGLIEAAKKFDPSMGTRFSTYAYYWIAQTVRRNQETCLNLIRWPAYCAWDLYNKNRSARQRRELTSGQRLVDNLDDPAIQKKALQLHYHDVFAERSVWLEEIERECEQALDQLSEIGGHVLRMRYGIGGQKEHTLEEVGRKLHYTRERVRQIQVATEEELHLVLRRFAPELLEYDNHVGL